MINILASQKDNRAAALVLAALQRSVTLSQAQYIALAGLESPSTCFVVAINPSETFALQLLKWLESGKKKLVLFGKIPASLGDYLGFDVGTWQMEAETWSRSSPAPTYQYSVSAAAVRYTNIAQALGAEGWQRPLERFDFTDEWNNLGYGAIRMDESIWSLAMPYCVPEAHQLAVIEVKGQAVASYAALIDNEHHSVLWVNRAVGTIDSFEWRLLENFISNYRHEELPCNPVISEVPWGYDAAVTMRLDCDEDIESARPLWNCYRTLQVPLSLAIHTSNLADARQHLILREFAAAGECIISHTATHASNWGGSYEAAFQEGQVSRLLLEAITEKTVTIAVSPFHQTPDYALEALVDAGYQACIGGIIRNDPEFLLARGGQLAFLPAYFIGHSQQCMLHGDCMLTQGDPLRIYKQAFDQARNTRTLFGYLDHPFSERYRYGWPDEASRIMAHRDLINYIRATCNNPLFLNEGRAMEFLMQRAQARIVEIDGKFSLLQQHVPTVDAEGSLTLALEYQGKIKQADGEWGKK